MIEDAFERKCTYGDFTIDKILKNDISFVSPVGNTVKISKNRIAQAICYSHKDLSILRNPEIAEAFARAFDKKPFEPLYAILSTIDPTSYPDYSALNVKYRLQELKNAVADGDYEKAITLTDVLGTTAQSTSEIGIAVMKTDDLRFREWFFHNVPSGSCNLNSVLTIAIEQNCRDVVSTILQKRLFDPNNDRSWRSPMKSALEHPEFVLPLLQHGFVLASGEYLASLNLDEIKKLLNYRVRLDGQTLDRIIQQKRFDILKIIDAEPQKYCTGEDLINAYLNGEDFGRFKNSISNGLTANLPERHPRGLTANRLFEKAFYTGEEWADYWLDNGYDFMRFSGDMLLNACRELKTDFAIYLMNHGADPYIRKEYSGTVLMAASGFHGHWDKAELAQQERLCRYLIDRGVDPIMESLGTPSIFTYLMNLSTEFKLYLIDWIAAHGEINFFECKNDPAISDRRLIDSVVGLNCSNYDPAVFRRMMEFGTQVVWPGQSKSKLFLGACQYCALEELRLFVDAGGNPDERNNDGTNGLFFAVLNKQGKDVIEYLIDLGLDVNSTRPGNYSFPAQSVLDIAEWKEINDVIAVLKNHGAKHAAELSGQ